MQGRKPGDLTGLYWSIFQGPDFRLHRLHLLGSRGARVGDTGWWGCPSCPPSSEGSQPPCCPLTSASCPLLLALPCLSEILKQIRVKQCPFYLQNLGPSVLPE